MTDYLVMCYYEDAWGGDDHELKSFPTEQEAWDYVDMLKKEDEENGDEDYTYDVYKRTTHFDGNYKYYTYE